MVGQQRINSLDLVNEAKARDNLVESFRSNNVFLGGSAMGKGLKTAARHYLRSQENRQLHPTLLELEGAKDLNEGLCTPLEESFYVVDIGVVISQVYQWRKYFPRVEPFYAIKCNPDPLIVRTLAILGLNFDCASRNEIKLVQESCADLSRMPEIIYANPAKSREHIIEAVCKGVRLMTFDNITEVQKCAAVSKKIQLILRIVTDDRGSQCRLSTKFGAPSNRWRPLLAEAKRHGLEVVGVSFHVGSGCRDASKYELALKDARELFDIAKEEYGFNNMHILDIGGGFPGETHGFWNPTEFIGEKSVAEQDEEEDDDDDDDEETDEGLEKKEEPSTEDSHFMFFTEIAEQVAPAIDKLFPIESGVRVIGEPGRFFVAAAATLFASVVSTRSNETGDTFVPEPINDKEAAETVDRMTRADEKLIVHKRALSFEDANIVKESIMDELADYSKLFARQNLAQQETDVYIDALDLYTEGIETARDLLGPPEEHQKKKAEHSVEGMNAPLIVGTENDESAAGILTLSAAGEAAVKGVMIQAVADAAPLQDDYAYYVNDGVYGAFNNLMFDHATVRPRVLRYSSEKEKYLAQDSTSKELYASTVFGPTCDSIDVIARSVLLPKLKIGDWLYFQNMGAYTMAAASSFNGFTPSSKFYVCSVPLEFFEPIIAGPENESTVGNEEEEKKADEE